MELTDQGDVTVKDNEFNYLSFVNVEVDASGSRGNAVAISCCGKILFQRCKIIGGDDGLCLLDNTAKARIGRTSIQ